MALRDTIRDEVHRLVGAGQMRLERAADDPGLFGPGSVVWQVHADFSAMMIGGVAALLTQMLHPGALAGVWDHSDWQKNPAGRLKRTAQFVAATTYAGMPQAHAQIARVRAIHDRVVGTLPDGTPYSANDPALLTWVHIAEADCFLRGYLAYREPGMPGARQDRYFAEMAVLARKMGADDVPESRRAVAAYFRKGPAGAVLRRTHRGGSDRAAGPARDQRCYRGGAAGAAGRWARADATLGSGAARPRNAAAGAPGDPAGRGRDGGDAALGAGEAGGVSVRRGASAGAFPGAPPAFRSPAGRGPPTHPRPVARPRVALGRSGRSVHARRHRRGRD